MSSEFILVVHLLSVAAHSFYLPVSSGCLMELAVNTNFKSRKSVLALT